MSLRFGVISADDHVQEIADLWTSRLSKRKWGDRIPHIEKQSDGTERWVIDGKVKQANALAWTGALAEDRVQEPQSWSTVPPASYEPSQRLVAMDTDGIDISVLYPSSAGFSGEAFAAVQDPGLEVECVQAYNDWLIDVWVAESDRFVPQCIIPMRSADAAVKELHRAVQRGHRGVVMPPIPWHNNRELPHISDRTWDPVWETVQDLNIPVCWHSGSDELIMLEIYDGYDQATTRAFDSIRRPVSNAIVLANFLMSGLPERHPGLNIVFSAAGIDWVPFQLELSDHEWHSSHLLRDGMEIKPTDIFRRQCYVTTWMERAAIDKQRLAIGTDNVMWQSEFPMETSTYPRSSELITTNFASVPASEREKILFRNAAGLYKISA